MSLTSFTYLLTSPAHLYIPQPFTHCLPNIFCVTLMPIDCLCTVVHYFMNSVFFFIFMYRLLLLPVHMCWHLLSPDEKKEYSEGNSYWLKRGKWWATTLVKHWGRLKYDQTRTLFISRPIEEYRRQFLTVVALLITVCRSPKIHPSSRYRTFRPALTLDVTSWMARAKRLGRRGHLIAHQWKNLNFRFL